MTPNLFRCLRCRLRFGRWIVFVVFQCFLSDFHWYIFFIVFGFVLKTEDIINTDSLVWSISIVIAIYLLRAIFLKLRKMDMQPLFYIAPRGLITVLLFLSITPEDRFPYLNESVVIQVILITTFIMMIGLVFEKKVTPEMLRFSNFKKDRHAEE